MPPFRSLAALLVLVGAARAQGIDLVRFDVAVPDQPRGVAAADFTGDGRGDLAVACAGPNRVSILAGLPSVASFAAPAVAGPSASGPNGLAAADFDGDGLLDLATASEIAPVLVVLHNAGTGSFSAFAPPSFSSSRWIESGDLDGDGRADLTTTQASTQTVYLANAGGSFSPPVAYPVPTDNLHCALGDVDVDGDLDVATGNHAPGLTVLRNDGTGSFTVVSMPGALGNVKQRVALGDVDGDGIPDLVSRLDTGLDIDTAFHRGTGAGFVSQGTLWFESRPELADLDGDGLADVTASYDATCCDLRVARANGSGGFDPHVSEGLPGDGWDLDAGDLDGGGPLDVAVAVPAADLVSLYLVVEGVPPVVTATSPLVVPSAAGTPVELRIQGEGFSTLTQIQLGSLSWTLPSTAVTVESATLVKVMLPGAVPGGPIETLALTNTFGAVQIPVIVGTPQAPVVLIQNPFAIMTGTAKLALGAPPGDFVFLGASPDLAPSSLPGLLDLAIGNGFASLVYLGASLMPVDGGVAKSIPLAGVSPFTFVHFQAVALDPAGSLPLPASNVATGLVF